MERKWIVLFSHKPERNYTYQKEIQHFIDCLQNDETPSITAEEGLKVVRVIEAANLSSSRDGARIKV